MIELARSHILSELRKGRQQDRLVDDLLAYESLQHPGAIVFGKPQPGAPSGRET